MIRKYYKDSSGKVFKNPLVLENGAKVYYPTPEQLAERGYYPVIEKLTFGSTAPKSVKLSKLSIIEYLGEAWPTWKAKIEAAGMWDYWEACTYIETANEKFKPFFNQLSAKEKADLIKNCRY